MDNHITHTLTEEVIAEQCAIRHLSSQASNILSEIQERTGFDFTDALNGLAVIDELTPRLTQVTPRVEAERRAF